MNNINKYLNENPLPWLLNHESPTIRFLSKRDILHDGSEIEEFEKTKTAFEEHSFKKSRNSLILGDKKNFDLYYTGTMWQFALAVEHGLHKKIEYIEQTAEFLFKKCQDSSGGFIFNWKPALPVACRTGNLLKYLILSGYNDERISEE